MENNNLGSLNELFTALAKAQSEMHAAVKGSDNPFFKSKYADFSEVVTASRPALAKNGLSVIQRIIIADDGSEILHSILGHISGQYIDSTMRIKPEKNDVQALGKYITYLKRYTYAALVGVITEDDDGNSASVKHGQESNTTNDYANDGVITSEELKALLDLLNTLPNATVLENNIKKFNNITDLSQLKQSKYKGVIAYIDKQS
jgi:hypothetical protein